MRRAKKRILPLALALALAIIGAALAVPVINVSVQQIGAGDSGVITPPIGQVNVTWELGQNPDFITAIDVTIDNNPGKGTLYVKFYNGTTMRYIAEINLDGTTSTTFTIDGSNIILKDASGADVTFPIDVHSFDFDTVKVVYKGS